MLETIKAVSKEFISTSQPEVMAIRGSWGVGKSYLWKEIVNENKNNAALESYCYVSLFGIESLSDLRAEIVAKVVPFKSIGKKLDAKQLNEDWRDWINRGARHLKKLAKALEGLPFANNVSIAFDTLAPHLIYQTVICLDDFERMNTSKLNVDDLLGFISSLKEEKGCKVVLIFNQEMLADKEIYEKYREKVIDIEVDFALTPEEAAKVAFQERTAFTDSLIKNSISLGITNIRVLRKIFRVTSIIFLQIKDLHPKIIEQVAMTATLMGWGYYGARSDDGRPSCEFILNYNSLAWMISKKQKETNEREEAWGRLLTDYGFTRADELDNEIFKVIKRGYLPDNRLKEEAIKLDASIRKDELDESFTAAWSKFHNTFENNEEELVSALRESFKAGVKTISPMNLSATASLLRNLGRDDIAEELIEFYVQSRSDEEDLFNLSEMPFGASIEDEAVRERFNSNYVRVRKLPTFQDAIEKVIAREWSSKDIEALGIASAVDYYNYFKANHSRSLQRLVKSCLEMERVGNTESYKAISARTREALERISKESRVNEMRVSRFGIEKPQG